MTCSHSIYSQLASVVLWFTGKAAILLATLMKQWNCLTLQICTFANKFAKSHASEVFGVLCQPSDCY